MRIHQPSQHRPLRYVVIATTVVVLALLGWLYYAYSQQQWPFPAPTPDSTNTPQNTVDYGAPTDEQISAGAAAKEQAINNSTPNPTAEPATPSSIPVSFTSVQPGETVYIRTLIGTVTSGATCSLTMSGPSGKSYSASAGVQALSSSSTCQGFNIPMSSLSAGTWKITVTVTDGSATGTATTEKTL